MILAVSSQFRGLPANRAWGIEFCHSLTCCFHITSRDAVELPHQSRSTPYSAVPELNLPIQYGKLLGVLAGSCRTEVVSLPDS